MNLSTAKAEEFYIELDFSGTDFDLAGFAAQGAGNQAKFPPAAASAGIASTSLHVIAPYPPAGFPLSETEIDSLVAWFESGALYCTPDADCGVADYGVGNKDTTEVLQMITTAPCTAGATLDIEARVVPSPSPSVSKDTRRQLIRLQTQLTTAVRQDRVRSLAIYSVGPVKSDGAVAIEIAKMIAGFSELKVALLGLSTEATGCDSLEAGLEIANTLVPNLLEVTSANRPVSLANWLRFAERGTALQRMVDHFNLTIIHGPSLTSNPEAALAADKTDGAILVVQANHTSQAELRFAYEILEQAGVSVLGVVLSSVTADANGAKTPFWQRLWQRNQ